MSEELNNKRKQLIFRSDHRGTKEMDLIMGTFAKKYVPQFDVAELAAYEELLMNNDPDLYNWLTDKEPVPVDVDGALFQKLKNHKIA